MFGTSGANLPADLGVTTPPPIARSCVLVVDDDVDLTREITDYVGRYEFRCVFANAWGDVEPAVVRERPDAIILDQWLGPVDALPRVPQLRRISSAPILILTANRDEMDRVLGLELGADDFLNKPVSGRELVARLRAHLRRRGPAPSSAWTLNRAAHCLLRSGGPSIRLTTAEFETLSRLAERPGVVHSRDELTRAVFNRPWQPGDRAVDTIVANLRAKVDAWQQGGTDAPSCITTVRPAGYRFVRFPEDPAPPAAV